MPEIPSNHAAALAAPDQPHVQFQKLNPVCTDPRAQGAAGMALLPDLLQGLLGCSYSSLLRAVALDSAVLYVHFRVSSVGVGLWVCTLLHWRNISMINKWTDRKWSICSGKKRITCCYSQEITDSSVNEEDYYSCNEAEYVYV